MLYRTTTDIIGPDVQEYEAENIEDALDQLRQDLDDLAECEPDFWRMAEEVDESWMEEA